MAESKEAKHKSKYKKPADSKKETRKDLKDYTLDDKGEALNPHSTGDKQKNVQRKNDKETVDNGSQAIDFKDKDRAMKTDGDHDPKHAAKIISKRQDDDEKDSKDSISDKVANLTREQKETFLSRLSPKQKEKFLREYIRNRIKKVLAEQITGDEEEPEEPNLPQEDPAPDQEMEPKSPQEPADVDTVGQPNPPGQEAPPQAPIDNEPEAVEEPVAEPEAEAPVEEPPAEDPAPEAPADDSTPDGGGPDHRIAKFVELLSQQPSLKHKIGMVIVALDQHTESMDPQSKQQIYNLLKLAATNKLSSLMKGSE